MSDVAVTQLVLLFTTVVTLIYQLYKDARDRRWKREEDERKIELAQQMEEWKLEMRQRTAHLSQSINDNTEISVQAFKEANDMNTKIFEVNQQILTTQKSVEEIAARPVVPAIPIRAEDAEEILKKRELPKSPSDVLTRRKEDRRRDT